MVLDLRGWGRRTHGYLSKREGFPCGETVSTKAGPSAAQCQQPSWDPQAQVVLPPLHGLSCKSGSPWPSMQSGVTIRGKYSLWVWCYPHNKAELHANDRVDQAAFVLIEAISCQLQWGSRRLCFPPDRHAPAVPGETWLVFNFCADFQFLLTLLLGPPALALRLDAEVGMLERYTTYYLRGSCKHYSKIMKLV